MESNSRSEITTDDTRAAEAATFVHEGREFTAGGFSIDVEAGRMIGYVGTDPESGRPILITWHGKKLADLAVTGRASGFRDMTGRRTKLVCYYTRQPIAGFYWYGRGLGSGMSLKLKRGQKAEG